MADDRSTSLIPKALSIAGSDPSGGAGLQADLKTFHQMGVYGMAATTLITVQTPAEVTHVTTLPGELVHEQVTTVLSALPPDAIKLGALGDADVVEGVATALDHTQAPIVVDPVIASSSGMNLLDDDGVQALKSRILPLAALLTPNLHEAHILTGTPLSSLDDVDRAALSLMDLGPRAVLIKGGHLDGPPIDVLCVDGHCHRMSAERVPGSAHGTGCVLSAAIAAHLARGIDLESSIMGAKDFITMALAARTAAEGLLNLFVPPPDPTAKK